MGGERDSSKKPVKLEPPSEEPPTCGDNDLVRRTYGDKPDLLKQLTRPKVIQRERIECDCNKCEEQQQQQDPIDKCGKIKIKKKAKEECECPPPLEARKPVEKTLAAEIFEVPRIFKIVGPKHIEIARQFIPNACIFGLASVVAFVYFTDWEPLARFVPFYNGKFKPKED